MKELLVLLVVFMVTSVVAFADEEVPVYQCQKVTEPPVIDGSIDDTAWRNLPVIAPFRLSTTGVAVQNDTEAQMCWDDGNLYVRFHCQDEAIWGTLSERDDPIFNEEVVEVFLRPDTEKLQYYEFNLSPRNVSFDALITIEYENGPYKGKAKWDCEGFEHAVFVKGDPCVKSSTDEYWDAELKIPFTCLTSQSPEAGDEWRGNIYRIEHGDLDEFQAWSPTFIKYPHFHKSLRFGRIQFVDDGSRNREK